MAEGSVSAEELVRTAISSHKVVVFSKSGCGYCAKAKRTLSKYPIKDIVIYELDSMDNGSAIQAALASLTGRYTVPNVFIGGKSIGGGDDTEALDRAGRLSTKLSEVSAI